ncbi:MAG TPA: PDZ domain-containing protein [Pyrinomonadaceae bacterium]|nr:PDZ domain-containing protein [Pyrinomonadaceae bacterium]
MEIKPQTHADANARPFNVETVSCPNCQAALVRGMRFCRRCGYRLDEGLAEYVETMRLDGALPVPAYAPPTVMQTPAPVTTTLAPYATTCRRRRRSRAFALVLMVALVSSGAGGVAWMAKVARNVGRVSRTFTLPRSFFGTEGFTTVDGGAMLDAVLPNGPADHAGLVGGDIITSFDGQAVRSSDDMSRLLRTTPIGKTVAIGFLRDGAAQVTTLVTVSSTLYDQGMFTTGGQQGFLGVDSYKRVPVAGTNLYGVRLDGLERNLPADIAGLRKGDIIINFDDTPIRTVGEFEARIHRAAPGQTVNVRIIRDGQQQTIPVKMGRR